MLKSIRYKSVTFILITLYLVSNGVFAQESLKILSHNDYDAWNNLSSWDVSNDGSYVYYAVNPQEGDGNLYLKTVKGELTRTIPRGQNPTFTYDSRFLIATQKISYEQDRINKKNKKKYFYLI